MVVVKLHSHLIICHCCSPILRQLFLLNMPLLPEPSASPGFYTPSLVWSSGSSSAVWQFFCCLVWSAPLPSHMNGPPPRTAAERTKEPVGPFRVYLQYSWSPGLACSRAFGDKMAVEVGVTHKPDVTVHTLTAQDRYLIVASDGVWELISSQVSSRTVQLCECCVDAAVLMQWC